MNEGVAPGAIPGWEEAARGNEAEPANDPGALERDGAEVPDDEGAVETPGKEEARSDEDPGATVALDDATGELPGKTTEFDVPIVED